MRKVDKPSSSIPRIKDASRVDKDVPKMDPHNGWSMDYVTQEYQVDNTGKPVAIYYPYEGDFEHENQSDFTSSFDRMPSDSTMGHGTERDAASLALQVASGELDVFDQNNDLPESLRLDVPLDVEVESLECNRIEGNPVAVLNAGLIERWKNVLPPGHRDYKRSVVRGWGKSNRTGSRFSKLFMGQSCLAKPCFFDKLPKDVEDDKGCLEYSARHFEQDLGVPARDLRTGYQSHMWRIKNSDE